MNKNRNFTKILLFIVIALILWGASYFIFSKDVSNTVNNHSVDQIDQTDPKNSNNTKPTVQAIEGMITITSPQQGSTIDPSAETIVSGKAVGNWFFEATAPVGVYDLDGKLLTRTYVSAMGEWMTTNYVDFTGKIAPFLTNGATSGYVQFSNSNPSDNEGFNRSLRIMVLFKTQETQTVKLYFGNTNKNPNTIDCSAVYSVERTIPKTTSVGTLTLRTLLQGPNESEVSLGYISALNNGSGDELKSLVIKNGVAIADFAVLPSAGSCLVGEARAQIEQTLKQFPTVKTVKILLNGSESKALQP